MNARSFEPELRDDCSRCAALCCVALAFDKSDMFAMDKPSGAPCRFLGASLGCTIHDRREQRGFRGCMHYSCLGAGQRVTQEIFDGRSWKDDKSLLEPMMEAFRGMRLVHDLLLLMNEAAKLPLEPQERREHQRLCTELRPAEGWTKVSLDEFERGARPSEIRRFLSSLKSTAARQQEQAKQATGRAR